MQRRPIIRIHMETARTMSQVLSRVIALCLIIGVPAAMPASGQDVHSRVKEYIDRELESNESPGIQYVVLSADSVLYSYAGGFADLAAQTALQENTTMMIYSMTKTITAAAVLQLVEQGVLGLDDPLTVYFADHPYREGITIRHLLSQTSGIPNPIPLRWVHLVEEHSRFDERAALQEVLKENAELDFAPGERYGYSNISYWLLGRVIEKVSGKSVEEYFRQNIFRQLGISPEEADCIIPSPSHHAKGYLRKWSFLNVVKSFLIDEKFIDDYEGGWLHIREHYLNGPSFGGIVASARAVGAFLQDQLREDPRLFSKQTRAKFFEQQKGRDGELLEMTLGWHVGENDGKGYYFKEGGGGGFHAEMRVYRSKGIATVVLANNTSFDVKAFLNTLDPWFLGHR